MVYSLVRIDCNKYFADVVITEVESTNSDSTIVSTDLTTRRTGFCLTDIATYCMTKMPNERGHIATKNGGISAPKEIMINFIFESYH